MTEERKWIKPHEGMKVSKRFDIMIRNEIHSIFDIEGSYHSLGTANGEPHHDTYWVMYKNEWCPYIAKSMNRVCYEINFKQQNTAKNKWDEWQFRRTGTCTIRANGKVIYEFFARDIDYAFAKAQHTLVLIGEHPYNFFDPSEEVGRKIWYYNLPATVKPSSNEPWNISIVPDYNMTGYTKETWWDEYRKRSITPNQNKDDAESDHEDISEAMEYGSINWGDALSDGNINWFRK